VRTTRTALPRTTQPTGASRDRPQISPSSTRVIACSGRCLPPCSSPKHAHGAGRRRVRRSQKGNNNAYCQDNEISWLDWKQAESEQGRALAAFTSRIADLRHHHAVLRAPRFLHGKDELLAGIRDIAWFDARVSWSPTSRGTIPRSCAWRCVVPAAMATARCRSSPPSSTPPARSSAFACRHPAGRHACCWTARSPTLPSATSIPMRSRSARTRSC